MSSNKTYINLGILAHVDAGKTSLTERLLYIGGAIDELGSVDKGSTTTDSLELEQKRGITIKTGVASFDVPGSDNNTQINLIDTPGHADFIAEVERVLNVLDMAILVVSGVEGVQAQTRVLYKSLRRLGIPVVFFINKMDRVGASYERTLEQIKTKLDADVEHVYSGSAITGEGVEGLLSGAIEVRFPSERRTDLQQKDLSATIFKIDRSKSGEKIAYVRIFSGTIKVRDQLLFNDTKEKVTAITVFENGEEIKTNHAHAGQIAKVRGLSSVKIGDSIGIANQSAQHFAPPTMESIVTPKSTGMKGALFSALAKLEEQDPLINLRTDETGQIHVSLYGEVQAQVIQSTLENDYSVEVNFKEATTICIEKVVGVGYGFVKGDKSDSYKGTVGLRIEPGEVDSGIKFQLEVEYGSIPLSFHKAVEETVYKTLQNGLQGWQVHDCIVIMTDSGYWPRQSHSHAKFDKSMSSTAGDFRLMTDMALRQALELAGTKVCEPIMSFECEVPSDCVAAVILDFARLEAIVKSTTANDEVALLCGDVPARRVQELKKRLPSLTRGEGTLTVEFGRYG